ncbi:MAG: hypothetical protein DI555_22350 [Novosphingobium pentaromativorans]|uniref:Uncharacterized protein n=2 Tax=Novosphingobium TaxID=165696 RepID=A0A2W5NFA8_9SPHN|nr:MAG: hypothetical protein DI555_22350 [Novosphingobium pentaromativorans]
MAEVMQAPLSISVNLDEIDKRFAGTIQMEYALQIPVTVASGDDLDVRKISLSTIRANSLKDAQPQISAFMKKRVTEQSNGDTGIFSAARWLNSRLPYEVFVLYPEDSMCDLNGPLTRTHMVKLIEYGA